MVPVAAARFGLDECNNVEEREFIELLHSRALAGDWYANSWPREDCIIISVDVCDRRENRVLRTLRIDFDGTLTAFGPDETHQLVTDLDPQQPGVTVLRDRPRGEMATAAADWIEREMKRPIIIHVWDRREFTVRMWILADTGERLAVEDHRVKRSPIRELGPPDRVNPLPKG